MYFYHYYENELGPLKNLSTLSQKDAQEIQNNFYKQNNKYASKRPTWYIERRFELEKIVRSEFIKKGGKPKTFYPHYFVVEKCDWLESWYHNPTEIKISSEKINKQYISFTYGDMFPTFSDIVNDGKEYRKKVYLYDEITEIITKYGLPQNWNPDGLLGPERYIEVQIWLESKEILELI
ncbi:MAG: hypothetical protein BKP49_05255 [Treponema sp. CETP13]|nr:MAG: hypothetical protein BKP49_05255 [Treponema sp. CETP13]